MTTAERAWTYRAVDGNGKRVQGHAEAADPRQLARALETKGLILVTADPDESGTGGSATPGLGSRHQILEVTRTLAALLPAGLPLARALRAAGNLATGRVGAATESIWGRVERSGDLDSAFGRLAGQLSGTNACAPSCSPPLSIR